LFAGSCAIVLLAQSENVIEASGRHRVSVMFGVAVVKGWSVGTNDFS
jgi:hypothetical protein